PASRCIDCELQRAAATGSAELPRRRARGRPAEVARSSRARIAFWIPSHRSTWDGDAGLSVVDRRFGACCLPPYLSRFCHYPLFLGITAALLLSFLRKQQKSATYFQIKKSRPKTITNYSSSINQRQTTTMGVCPNRLVLINGVNPAP